MEVCMYLVQYSVCDMSGLMSGVVLDGLDISSKMDVAGMEIVLAADVYSVYSIYS